MISKISVLDALKSIQRWIESGPCSKEWTDATIGISASISLIGKLDDSGRHYTECLGLDRELEMLDALKLEIAALTAQLDAEMKKKEAFEHFKECVCSNFHCGDCPYTKECEAVDVKIGEL